MELIAPVRVVVVDDNASHLVSITNGLANAGIPCIPHLYDIDSRSLNPPAPDGGYPHLRMIFTDVNILEMSGGNAEPKSLASTLIAEVLMPLVARTSGPYAVCLWTSTGRKAEEVSPLISERIDHESQGADRRPAPLTVNILEKKDFISENDESSKEALEILFKRSATFGQRIGSLISQKLSDDPQLKAALSWESRASLAAAQTINNVYQVSSSERTATIKESEAFQIVLTKMAIEAAGHKNAKTDAPGALDDGLADLFLDEMRNSVTSPDYVRAVDESISATVSAPPPLLSVDSRISLNTILHIERQVPVSNRIERGLVLEINSDTVLTDLKLGSRKKLLWGEFLYNSSLLERALEEAKRLDDSKISEFEERLDFCTQHKDEVLEQSKIVMVEIGADCDHAQRKDRTLRFLLGVEIPTRLSALTLSPVRNALRSESLRAFDAWRIDGGNDFQLLVSLSRFSVRQDWLMDTNMTPRYRLRRSLVEQLLHSYSTHSTRPGIIAIT